MNIKRILFTEANKAQLLDAEIGEPSDGSVAVEMLYTAISNGTERANLTGNPNVSMAAVIPVTFPRSGGYSGYGKILSVGKNVKSVAVGDYVCTSWGTHASDWIFPESNVLKVDSGIDGRAATFAHISTFPMAAVRKTHLSIGESAMVMGLGVLGMFAVQLLKAAGAVPLIAVDPRADRRELALINGADYALDPTEDGFANKVKLLSDGGVNVAIEVTGLGKGLDQALDCMAKFGRVALLGCTRDSDFSIDYYRKVHGPGITLVGAHTMARPAYESNLDCHTERDDKKAYLKLVSRGRIDPLKFISEIHTPDEAPEVYNRLAFDRDFPLGVMFKWH